jgi:hypothetical protein
MPHFECGAFNRSATSPDAGAAGGALHTGWAGTPQGLNAPAAMQNPRFALTFGLALR